MHYFKENRKRSFEIWENYVIEPKLLKNIPINASKKVNALCRFDSTLRMASFRYSVIGFVDFCARYWIEMSIFYHKYFILLFIFLIKYIPTIMSFNEYYIWTHAETQMLIHLRLGSYFIKICHVPMSMFWTFVSLSVLHRLGYFDELIIIFIFP